MSSVNCLIPPPKHRVTLACMISLSLCIHCVFPAFQTQLRVFPNFNFSFFSVFVSLIWTYHICKSDLFRFCGVQCYFSLGAPNFKTNLSIPFNYVTLFLCTSHETTLLSLWYISLNTVLPFFSSCNTPFY